MAEEPSLPCHPHLLPNPYSNSTPYPNPDQVFPDEMMREILLWLPVKSLMRFKCVSKLWLSIILDPSFARAYRRGFRGLILSDPYFERLAPTKDFFYVSLDGGQISHHLAVEHDGGRSLGYTEIVNGLVCFYYGNYSCLYNVATRESMELPRSEYGHSSATYHLGFDPVDKLYKLLKICPVYSDDDYDGEDLREATWLCNLDYSEILTIGTDASWRRIAPAPREIVERAVCLDGALYWLENRIKNVGGFDGFLIAFHLAQEKFEFVPTPGRRLPYRLPYFGTRLSAITSYPQDGVIYSHGDGGWRVEHRFDMPQEPDHEFCAVGILPDGKVVIYESTGLLYFPAPFYLYDQVEKKLTRIVICRSPSSSSLEQRSKLLFRDDICGYLSYYEENIIPLSYFATPYP
ncbi:putative F-box protein At1g32420 [Coffea arabica]|uniref:F-box protein At1g32420 n=1 Tax=Coffea arabica TaxID=13443 RepID=A0A6P6TWT3_COFAR|nr:putative F-box protein At1g47790 [Coffea arabica]XP_027082783.1 putative F-box protein At1g47790 [Coffea arabica]XP_027082784.1 putative F-box protein At1g47790 [Coffea arabica]XP_027082785.1 putative F-box protein At1g47790 [Coffea arabica]XP_027082786.1 putative F-box protein At1g47790 [Coffea arabica]XP_027082787.1 putative F-box protein At1g47790 [Coffea arabica]XP_027082788.1 putative F-box protein At1g47790 [Coffea arabica]XP_027082795.1 putative F-box protein At1g47790 [Coffea arab